MPGLCSAQDAAAATRGLAAPVTRRVVVDDPQRLTRETLVAAIDAAPGLAAIDGSEARPDAVGPVDAAVLAARSLRRGWYDVFAGAGGPAAGPVVVVADNGPVTPSADTRGVIVVSRDTPLRVIVDCLRTGAADLAGLHGRPAAAEEAHAALTPRERQVLGLLASGLSPTEVARGLAITTYTARDHIKAIRQKLDRPTIMAAVLEAMRRGVLQPDRS